MTKTSSDSEFKSLLE